MNDMVTPYQQRLHLTNATFTRIEQDDAIVAIVYKIIPTKGTPLILKICTRAEEYLRELYFLNHFANKLPVPHVVQVVPPEQNLKGAILMQCLPGTPISITDLTDRLAYEMGSLLAMIHTNRTTTYGDLTAPNQLSPDPRAYFCLQFEKGFKECSKHLPSTLIEQSRRYYETHLDLLSQVDGPCMVHRDFRPGNVIVQDGKLQGIIDWAAGRASFAQEDFYPMEHWEWPTHPTSKTSFLAGYASIRPVPSYQEIMPLLRLSRALATIGFTLKRGTWNTSNARVYEFNRHFVETFFNNPQNLTKPR